MKIDETVDSARNKSNQDPEGTSDLRLVRSSLMQSAPHVDQLLSRLRIIPRILHAQNLRIGEPLGEHSLDDLAQDVFMVVWSKLDSYNGQRPLEAWVYGICKFKLMNAIRRQAPRQTEELEPDLPAGKVIPSFAYEELYRGLERLSDGAAIVNYKHFEGLTFEEIAVRLSVPTATAKTRYYRALRQLKEYLTENQTRADKDRHVDALSPGKSEARES